MGKWHGGKGTPEYSAWQHMKQRCLNPNSPDYPAYGGRGIMVDARWMRSFPAFLAEIGPRPSPKHSVDRIDGTRGYEPGNVRWATPTQQSRNRPGFVKNLNGQTAAEAAASIGLRPPTLYNRLREGMDVDRALTKGRLPSGKPPRLMTHEGKTLPLRAWARETGIKATTIRERLKRGWSVGRALTTTPRRNPASMT